MGQFPDYIEPTYIQIYGICNDALILKLDDRNNIKWRFKADAFEYSDSLGVLYLKDEKVGIIKENVINDPSYAGVTLDDKVVAIVYEGKKQGKGEYFKGLNETVEFYQFVNDKLVCFQDNENFNPCIHTWFPKKFKEVHNYQQVPEDNNDEFWEPIDCYNEDIWTDDDADIAYEGYSRLYLGLD